MGSKIAVIEDETDVRSVVMETLADAGFQPVGYADGRTGLDGIRRSPPSLVLLDLALPGMDGIQVCKSLRSDPVTSRLPVVMLTGLTGEAEQLLGFEVGADDYVTKPWKPRTLIARIKAVLRRVRPMGADEPLVHGPLTLYPGRREAVLESKPLALTPTEFRILHLLAMHPERALTRAELLEGEDGSKELTERNVDVHVLAIRRKLDRSQWLVSTVWGIGYRIGQGPSGQGGKP